MSGFKRVLDAVRDEGTDAFYAGNDRASPYGDDVKSEYWLEGWDFGQDMEARALEDRERISEIEIEQMNGYWEAFYAGEKVHGGAY